MARRNAAACRPDPAPIAPPELSLPDLLARVAAEQATLDAIWSEMCDLSVALARRESPDCVVPCAGASGGWIRYSATPSTRGHSKGPFFVSRQYEEAPETLPDAVRFTAARANDDLALRIHLTYAAHHAAACAWGDTLRLVSQIIDAAFDAWPRDAHDQPVVRACGRTWVRDSNGWRAARELVLDDDGRIAGWSDKR